MSRSDHAPFGSSLASFVEIADDLPVTGHRLSRTVRDTDAARSMVEVFAIARFCPMELITILNRCHRFRGFVYHRARFTSDHKSIEISVRPRKLSAAICSRCDQYAPGYDQLLRRSENLDDDSTSACAICSATTSRPSVPTFSRKPFSNSGNTIRPPGSASSWTSGAARPCDPASNP